ncbi:MAG: NAD-binding protein, partial [Deltaproteobacteria bacterium]
MQGDGSHPNILREVNPEQTDFLFCLTNNDQDNLIASLGGRSLGFK